MVHPLTLALSLSLTLTQEVPVVSPRDETGVPPSDGRVAGAHRLPVHSDQQPTVGVRLGQLGLIGASLAVLDRPHWLGEAPAGVAHLVGQCVPVGGLTACQAGRTTTAIKSMSRQIAQ